MPESPRLLLVMSPSFKVEDFFDEASRATISRVTKWPSPQRAYSADALPDDLLAETEILLTSWGAPLLDEAFLARAPRLRAVVHAAGSVKEFVTDVSWERGIEISSAAWANAVPVAEYTLAAILYTGKHAVELRDHYRLTRSEDLRLEFGHIGNYRRTVGIIGASLVGRRVLELLREHDFTTLVYDPFLTEAEAARLSAQKVGLDELCARSHVVSVHAPETPETRGMLDARRLALIPDGATVINTARGSLIETDALVKELSTGRIRAVLDVVSAEPDRLPALLDLPNAFLTPHVAGSYGNELLRLGAAATAELERYITGSGFAHPVNRERLVYAA